jgi:hypothetical protein
MTNEDRDPGMSPCCNAAIILDGDGDPSVPWTVREWYACSACGKGVKFDPLEHPSPEPNVD